jgi:hypothetical protein
MLKEVGFVEELGLWLATFGDINLLYDDITRDLWLKPEEITDGIILLRNLGVGRIYNFYMEDLSNVNTTKSFFLYRKLNSEVILAHNKRITVLAFEENGQTVYKPDKVKYYCYRNTEIYQLYPRNAYHVYYEGVKLITPGGEIVINQAYSRLTEVKQ